MCRHIGHLNERNERKEVISRATDNLSHSDTNANSIDITVCCNVYFYRKENVVADEN